MSSRLFAATGREQSELREALWALWTNRVMQCQWGNSPLRTQETHLFLARYQFSGTLFSNIAKKFWHFANKTFWNILERAIAVAIQPHCIINFEFSKIFLIILRILLQQITTFSLSLHPLKSMGWKFATEHHGRARPLSFCAPQAALAPRAS